jgi:hypothetical protein
LICATPTLASSTPNRPVRKVKIRMRKMVRYACCRLHFLITNDHSISQEEEVDEDEDYVQ